MMDSFGWNFENIIPMKLGDMLRDARKYFHLSAEAMFHHICSKSAYYEVENGFKTPDTLLFNALMERVGMSAVRFHIVTTQAEVDFFTQKETSMKAVLEGDVDKISNCLDRIRGMEGLNRLIKEQWECYLEYVLIIKRRGHTREAYDTICRAVELSVGNPHELDFKKRLLGGEEIQLLVMFIAEELKQDGSRAEYMRNLLDKVYCYVKERIRDDREKAVLLSRIAGMEIMYFHDFQAAAPNASKEEGNSEQIFVSENLNHLFSEKEIPVKKRDEKDICNIKDAFEHMRHNETLCDMLLLLGFLAKNEEDAGKREQYSLQGRALEKLMNEYGNGYMYRVEEIYFELPKIAVIGEFLQNGRKDKKYTQMELSDGICAEQTYSRIETGREPTRRNLEMLLDRLGLRWGYYGGVIATDKIACHILRINYELAFFHKEYEKARKLLQELQRRLDMSNKQNEQYVQFCNIVFNIDRGCLDVKDVDQLWKTLEITNANLDSVRFYSQMEHDIFYYLEKVYRYHFSMPEKAKQIAEICIKNEKRKSTVDKYLIKYHERTLAGVYSDYHDWKNEKRIAEKWVMVILKDKSNVTMLGQFIDLLSESIRNIDKNNQKAKELLLCAIYFSDLYGQNSDSQMLRKGFEILYKNVAK